MFQEKLIFYPEKLPRNYVFEVPAGTEEIFIHTKGSNEVNGLFYSTQPSNHVVLYFHGNAGSLRSWKEVAPDFTSRGLNLLIIDYHGYGKSSGKFSEQNFYDDGMAAYEFLLKRSFKPEQIIIYGRSVGTGVAVDLAAKQPAAGLILESPFSSLLQLGKEKYAFLFPSLWARYRFDNLEKARQLTMPVLIIHGDADGLIPPVHSERLLREIKSPSKLVLIPGGNHNDLGSFPEYDWELDLYLESLRSSTTLKR